MDKNICFYIYLTRKRENMYNTQIFTMPAYTNREFMNFGLHKKHELYSYKFTPNDRALLISGAISLFPRQFYEYKASHDTNLSGKKVKANEILDYKNFEDNTLNMLMRTGVISCTLKPEFKDLSKEDLIKTAKLYNAVGLSIKEVSDMFDIDIQEIRTILGLKNNATKKQIKEEDLEKLQVLLKEAQL